MNNQIDDVFELIRFLAGWSMSEMARRLDMTERRYRYMVNGGDIMPKRALLALIEVAEKAPIQMSEAELMKIYRKLNGKKPRTATGIKTVKV